MTKYYSTINWTNWNGLGFFLCFKKVVKISTSKRNIKNKNEKKMNHIRINSMDQNEKKSSWLL